MVDAVLNRPFNLKVARDRKGMAPDPVGHHCNR